MRISIFKRVITFCALSAFIFTSILSAQSKFEGKVVFNFKDDNSSHDMTYFVKNNKFRIEVSEAGHDAAMIFSPEEKSMMMLMPEQKMYMEFPLDKLSKYNSDSKDKNDEGKITKTKETKVIKGYKCTKWVIDNPEGQSIAWMTDELGGFMFMKNPMMKDKEKPDWQKEIEAAGYFPMLVINNDKNGKEKSRLEVTDIEKKKLDSSLFSVPSGYNKFNMPMMNGKMK